MPYTITLPSGRTVKNIPDNLTAGGALDRLVQARQVSAQEAQLALEGQVSQAETGGNVDEFLIGAGEFFSDRIPGLQSEVRAPGTLAANLGRIAPAIATSFLAPGTVGAQAALAGGLEFARQGSTLQSTATAGLLGGAGAGLGNVASRVINRIGAQAQRIPRTLGQVVDSDFLRRVESGINSGGGFDFLLRAQRKALNQAWAKAIGQNADTLGPDVIGKAADDIGAVYEKLFPENKLFNLRNTLQELDSVDDLGSLRKLRANINPGGTATGATVKNLRTKLQQRIRSLRGQNDDLADQLDEVADALGTELESQMTKGQLSQFRTAREQWKNLRILEAMPEVRATGQATARQSANALSRPQAYGTTWTRGRSSVLDDTDELFQTTRAAAAVGEIVGDSGTATRAAVLAGLGAIGGAVYEGDLEGALKFAAIGAIPYILGRASVATGSIAQGAASQTATRLGQAAVSGARNAREQEKAEP